MTGKPMLRPPKTQTMNTTAKPQPRPEPAANTFEAGNRQSRGFVNDFTNALGQQMFFWGRDVLHEGNLLLAYGFEKRRSPGLQGTSCYRVPWREGFVELHGACAGWYGEKSVSPGFLFVRSDKRCYAHRLSSAVIPGRHDHASLSSGNAKEVLEAGRTFASWLVHYEEWILSFCCEKHRQECFRMFSRLPTSRPWLPPEKALPWLSQLARGSSQLQRARLSSCSTGLTASRQTKISASLAHAVARSPR